MPPTRIQPERNRITIPATILAVPENLWLRNKGDSLEGMWAKSMAKKEEVHD